MHQGSIISFNANLSESLILEYVDHILMSSDKIVNNLKLGAMFSAALLILLTNAMLIRLILEKMSRTFLDNLMLLDSFFCICNIYSLFVMSNLVKLCEFSVPFIFTLNLFNRTVSFVTPLYLTCSQRNRTKLHMDCPMRPCREGGRRTSSPSSLT